MNQIFKIKISKVVGVGKGKKTVSVTLLDSYYQLPFKLDTLAKKFNTDTQKSPFPYNFVTQETLFYEGATPDYKYYEGKIDEKTYNEIVASVPRWSTKKETLQYLANDLDCLYQVMHTYNRGVYDDFLVNVVGLSSYSGFSKRVYLSNYYDKVKDKIPVISGYLEYQIRKAYKGGVVDVCAHIVSGGYKYDSNSHYPAAMLNDMPVGIPRLTDIKDLNKIFGYCYVEVTAPSEEELLCAILPTHDENGDLYCPRGT